MILREFLTAELTIKYLIYYNSSFFYIITLLLIITGVKLNTLRMCLLYKGAKIYTVSKDNVRVTIPDLSVRRDISLDSCRRDCREIARTTPGNVIRSIHRVFCHRPINYSNSLKYIYFYFLIKCF